MKKIALIIAHEGFQQTEYNVPKKILENNGIEVITVSDEPGTATAKDQSKVTVDKTIEQINPEEFDGIFIIGGPGALDCLDNNLVHDLMKKISELKKPFGAICISPRILAHANLLTNKKATGWNGDGKLQEIFNNHNVEYVKNPVVVDEKIVTATGPDAADEFAEEILKVIKIHY